MSLLTNNKCVINHLFSNCDGLLPIKTIEMFIDELHSIY